MGRPEARRTARVPAFVLGPLGASALGLPDTLPRHTPPDLRSCRAGHVQARALLIRCVEHWSFPHCGDEASDQARGGSSWVWACCRLSLCLSAGPFLGGGRAVLLGRAVGAALLPYICLPYVCRGVNPGPARSLAAVRERCSLESRVLGGWLARSGEVRPAPAFGAGEASRWVAIESHVLPMARAAIPSLGGGRAGCHWSPGAAPCRPRPCAASAGVGVPGRWVLSRLHRFAAGQHPPSAQSALSGRRRWWRVRSRCRQRCPGLSHY